jgi:hypothetical protein
MGNRGRQRTKDELVLQGGSVVYYDEWGREDEGGETNEA